MKANSNSDKINMPFHVFFLLVLELSLIFKNNKIYISLCISNLNYSQSQLTGTMIHKLDNGIESNFSGLGGIISLQREAVLVPSPLQFFQVCKPPHSNLHSYR